MLQEKLISGTPGSVSPRHRSEREERIQTCVRRILNSEGIPPFREHAHEIIARTMDLDGSCSQLARIVLKDLGLTTQILRHGNSAAYNRSGRPIMSVAHAITLLGWETVRSLVGALKYIQHFAGCSPGLRELMALSLLSGFHGREIAAVLRYPWPEEAYIAGLFRSLGEVLIARHYPKEYSEILLAIEDEKVPPEAACVRILGFPWDEAGARIAQSWNLPSKVVMCLSGRNRAARSALDRCLASIADYGLHLTNSLYRDGAAIDSVQLQTVIDPAGQRCLVSGRDLERVVNTARSDTRATLEILRIPSSALRLASQAVHARSTLASIGVFDAAGLRSLDKTIEEATRLLVRGDFELSSLVVSLIDEVHAAGFDRVVFGLVNEERTHIRGRIGSGESCDFEFPLEGGDGPLLAFERNHDVVVDRALDDRYDQSRLVRTLDPKVFALLPIVIDSELVGFLYADCRRAVSGLDNARGPCLRVRDIITQAIRRKAPSSPGGRGRVSPAVLPAAG